MPIKGVGFNVESEEIAMHEQHADFKVNFPGMSIRTELAARAMEGFASNSYWGKTMEWEEYRDRLVKASVDLADSLIKELNKPNE